jgi:hypothetical protein
MPAELSRLGIWRPLHPRRADVELTWRNVRVVPTGDTPAIGLSAAEVNAHGRLAARYDHSSTRGHETGRGHLQPFVVRTSLAITSDSDNRDSA